MQIVFEGIDGCGKTTQVKMLEESLRRDSYYPEVVKHPGQTRFGQEIRDLILNGTQPKSHLAHRLLFWADFAETAAHYKDKRLLIFDRYPYFSDYAYGLGLSNNQDEAKTLMKEIKMLQVMTSCLTPDLVFLIDVPVEIAASRLNQRNDGLTVIEKRGPVYFNRVRKAYLELAKTHKYVTIIDGNRDALKIHSEILENTIPYLTILREKGVFMPQTVRV